MAICAKKPLQFKKVTNSLLLKSNAKVFLIFWPLTEQDFYLKFAILTEINGFYMQRHLT